MALRGHDMETLLKKTKIGNFICNKKGECLEYLGIRFAHAERFEYAQLIDKYDEVDATKPKPTCMQKRNWSEFEHLEIPERAFYHKEYREGINFEYEEDALYLNIYAPKEGENHPVIVFLHGGGFDSGSINESPFNGEALAKRGNVVVFAEYRVGILGYFTHEEIYKENNRDGNFGLDDMVKALEWVKKNIQNFGGDASNVTVMGQSAGAMSIQYMLCNPSSKELFDKAIMMSGAGLFPKFSLPRPCESTREYWKEVIEISGVKSFAEFKKLPPRDLLQAVETQKGLRKDNTYNTMPVIDGYLIKEPIDKAIKNPYELPLMIGFTNNDMFTYLLAHISKKYARKHNGYLYYFDIDAKGDDNQAFHSADLRYVFGTLEDSWRPYDEHDKEISNLMMDYISSFAKTGNPNHDGAPRWDIFKSKALCLTDDKVEMATPKRMKLLKNTLKGDPR